MTSIFKPLPEPEKTDAPTQEAALRSSLEDAVILVRALLPVCNTPAELLGVMQFALQNEAQLRLIMAAVDASQRK